MFLTFERKDNRFFKPISEDFGMLCKTQIKTDCSDLQSSCSHSLFTIEHKQCIKCIRNTLAHFEFDGSTKKKKSWDMGNKSLEKQNTWRNIWQLLRLLDKRSVRRLGEKRGSERDRAFLEVKMLSVTSLHKTVEATQLAHLDRPHLW